MINFLYLVGFAFLVTVVFSVIEKGTLKEKIYYGLKIFGQFILISMAMAYALYFIPW